MVTATALLANCIGCGCDDHHACGDGCWWLRVDYGARLGVCSSCEAFVEQWDAGDRTPHAAPIAELEDPALQRVPRPEQRRPRLAAGERCQHDWPFEDVQDQDQCRWCGMSFTRYVFTECP